MSICNRLASLVEAKIEEPIHKLMIFSSLTSRRERSSPRPLSLEQLSPKQPKPIASDSTEQPLFLKIQNLKNLNLANLSNCRRESGDRTSSSENHSFVFLLSTHSFVLLCFVLLCFVLLSPAHSLFCSGDSSSSDPSADSIRFDVVVGIEVETDKYSRSFSEQLKQRNFQMNWGNGWSNRRIRKDAWEADPAAEAAFSGNSVKLDATALKKDLDFTGSVRDKDTAIMYLHTSYHKQMRQIEKFKGKNFPEFVAVLPSDGDLDEKVRFEDRFDPQIEVATIDIRDGFDKSIFSKVEETRMTSSAEKHHEMRRASELMHSISMKSCVIVTCPEQKKKPIKLGEIVESIKLVRTQIQQAVAAKYGKKNEAAKENVKIVDSLVGRVSTYVRRSVELSKAQLARQDETGYLKGLSSTCKAGAIASLDNQRARIRNAVKSWRSGTSSDDEETEEDEIPEYVVGQVEEIRSLLEQLEQVDDNTTDGSSNKSDA